MRILLSLLFFIALIVVGLTAFNVFGQSGFQLFILAGPIAVYLLFKMRYKTLQHNMLDESEEQNGTSFYGVRMSSGGAALINRSGMGVSYDARNPITFVTVTDVGINGLFTLDHGYITSVRADSELVATIDFNKKPTFLYGKSLSLQFKTKEDTDAFVSLVNQKIHGAGK